MNNKNINSVNPFSQDSRLSTINELKKILPEIFTENDNIDFDKLKTILSDNIDSNDEKYSFNWNGKKQAIKAAQIPTTSTLKLNKEKSKNLDSTKNLYIEGDNLEVLKLLQKSYSNKIKLIYIDPPYNTGKDFVYKDNFSNSINNYLEQTGQIDNEGKKLRTNTETNGRFHTDWLNLMYPRLKLAKNLLSEDGVIFISIDDSEQANLKKICDEIFGENNFIAQVIWERAYSPVNLKKNFSENHDYILVYGKDLSLIESNGLKRSSDANDRYTNPDNDPRGVWKSSDLSVGPAIAKNIYNITTPSGRITSPPSGYSWRLSKERFEEFVNDNRIWFGPNGDATPSIKRFLSEVKQTIVPMTIWNYEDVGHSQSASQYLKKLFDNKAYFSYPKPVPLVQRIIELYSEKDSIILDFFSGSATTAEAVIKMNMDDGGERRFIMVQLPEKLSEKDVAYKDGYRTIPEIAEERIRRIENTLINEDTLFSHKVDTGFKVFELDKSNIKKWNSNTSELEKQLSFMEENFEKDSKPIDIVYEILIKQGLDLAYPITEHPLNEETIIYDVAFGAMFVVLGGQITIEASKIIVNIIEEQEVENSIIVFQDEKFLDDSEKLNTIEYLNSHGIQYEDILSI